MTGLLEWESLSVGSMGHILGEERGLLTPQVEEGSLTTEGPGGGRARAGQGGRAENERAWSV